MKKTRDILEGGIPYILNSMGTESLHETTIEASAGLVSVDSIISVTGSGQTGTRLKNFWIVF